MFQMIRQSFIDFVPGLTTDELDRICLRLQPKSFARKTIIVPEGQICQYVYFINSGAVRLFNRTNGLDRNAEYVFENNWISEYRSFVTRGPAIQSLEAIEDCEMLMLSYNDVQESYNTNPKFERFGRLIAEFILAQTSNNEIENGLYTPEERYLRLIEKDSIMLKRLTQQQIAAYLGIQPESLSRIRRRLAQKT
ncbi:MAG: Crp/Fnr family transcriptional regulator [Bacteroidetes bacterium]|nr:MAG: Crp/Fnr family transcriptional regulator [Bacteroidota bacterium]